MYIVHCTFIIRIIEYIGACNGLRKHDVLVCKHENAANNKLSRQSTISSDTTYNNTTIIIIIKYEFTPITSKKSRLLQ